MILLNETAPALTNSGSGQSEVASLETLVSRYFEAKKKPSQSMSRDSEHQFISEILDALEPSIQQTTYKAFDLREDAANEARMRIWLQLTKMDEPPENIQAYCRKIAHFAMADTLQKSVKTEETSMPENYEYEATDLTTPWDMLESKDRTEWIRKLLASVENPLHKQIALVHWTHNKSKAETARLLGVNESTVNTVIGRLKKQIISLAKQERMFERTALSRYMAMD